MENKTLRKRRLARSLSQETVAHACGITSGFYGVLERGDLYGRPRTAGILYPKTDVAIKISRMLSTPVEELWPVEEEPKP